MLFLLSGAFLGFMFYWAFYKNDVPDFIKKFFISQSYLYDKNDGEKRKAQSIEMMIYKGLLSVVVFASTYFFLQYWYPYERGIVTVKLMVSLFMLTIGYYAFGERAFQKVASGYKKQKEKDDIISSNGAVDFGNKSDIERVLPDVGASSVNVAGVFFGKLAKKGHVITIGSARGGKGSCLLLPALLDITLRLPDAPSFIVLDPRGENLAVAGAQLERMGYKLIVLNPYAIPEITDFGNARFNPFDLFTADSPDFNKYVDLILHAISPPETSKHANSYFGDAARDMISLYMRYMMCQDIEPKNITTVYRWMRLGKEERGKLFDAMDEIDRHEISSDMTALLNQITDGGKSLTDVYGNAVQALTPFRDEPIRQSMSASDFTLSEIASEKTALFICLGAEDMERQKAWLRIVTSSIMRGFMRNYNLDRKVVMLLDEFISMGSIAEFANIQILANYNVTAWIVAQDLSQLKALYPNWENFINNSIIRHWIKCGDNFTADYVSKRMPATIKFMGENSDGSPKIKEKPLLTPQEVQVYDNIIMEVDGVPYPISVPRKPYWDFIPPYAYDPNPFYK